MKKFAIGALLLLIALCGCSASVDISAAEAMVPKFHKQLDAEQFSNIYSSASQDLKGATSEKDFTALLEAVHRKLGAVVSTAQESYNINYHTSGKFVTLTYKTAYKGGDAMETFTYRIKDDSAVLAGYFINSNALLLK